MNWYALENVNESFERTRKFLFPIRRHLWAKLGIIILFIGLGAGFPGFPVDGVLTDLEDFTFDPSNQIDDWIEDIEAEDEAEEIVDWVEDNRDLLVTGIIAVFGAGLFLFYLSLVFRFIFYKSLELEEVGIRAYFGDYWLMGIKYFFFTILVYGLILAGFGLAFYIGAINTTAGVLTGVIASLFALLLYLILFFTNNLVLPEIVKNNVGFLEGLSNSYDYVSSEWSQSGLFVLVRAVLEIIIQAIGWVLLVLTALILLIPFGIVGLVLSGISLWLGGLIAVLYLLSIIIAGLAVFVPLQSFIFNYVLLFHRDISDKITIETR